jgi:hypothetical protein
MILHSKKCPRVLALDLRLLRYIKRSSMESFGPAVCNLCTSPVTPTMTYALGMLMNIFYTHLLKLSVLSSVRRNSCSVMSHPGKNANLSSGMWCDNSGYICLYSVFDYFSYCV